VTQIKNENAHYIFSLYPASNYIAVFIGVV